VRLVAVVLLCGPPCSGKTTLARYLAQPGDLLLDFDDIARSLGSPELWLHPEPYKTDAEQVMRHYMATIGDQQAYVIRAAPKPEQRAAWAQWLGAECYLLNPGVDECLRRAATRPPRTKKSIRSWYWKYRPWAGDRDPASLLNVTEPR
jgi:hypothetical protein